MSSFSVVLPAHDEARVIAHSLTSLALGAADGEIEVVVVCNGCTDRTAEVARDLALPGVSVLEIPEASKAAALNAGDAAVTAWPRFYIDADIPAQLDMVRAMAQRLRQGDIVALSASTNHLVTTRSALVRSFYALWSRLPAASEGLAGTGIIGMTETARSRFEQWPDLLADDYFADSVVAPSEQIRFPGAKVTLSSPGRVGALIKRRARVHNGNVQASAAGVSRPPRQGNRAALRAILQKEPRLLINVPGYLTVTAAARLLAAWDRRRGRATVWRRDDNRSLDRRT